MRDELLNETLFFDLDQARELIRRAGRGLQHGKAALLTWLPEASGLCRPADRATRATTAAEALIAAG